MAPSGADPKVAGDTATRLSGNRDRPERSQMAGHEGILVGGAANGENIADRSNGSGGVAGLMLPNCHGPEQSRDFPARREMRLAGVRIERILKKCRAPPDRRTPRGTMNEFPQRPSHSSNPCKCIHLRLIKRTVARQIIN